MPTTAQIAETLAAHQTERKYTLTNFGDTHLRRGLFNFFGGGITNHYAPLLTYGVTNYGACLNPAIALGIFLTSLFFTPG